MMNKELLKLAYEVLKKCQSDSLFESEVLLGMGCERIAYKINEDYVVKIAKKAFLEEDNDNRETYGEERYYHSDEGQTEREIKIWGNLDEEQKKLFNPIVVSGEFDGFAFIVSPCISLSYYSNAMTYCEKNELDFNFSLLSTVAEKFELCYHDMTRNCDNFGLSKEGKLVISDFGLLEY